MKIYCLTQNQELEIGLKLAGCEALCVDNKNVKQKFDEILKKEDLGILLLSKELYGETKEKIEEIRAKQKIPLITII